MIDSVAATGAWRPSGPTPATPGSVLAPVDDLLGERELWRVRAGRGGLEPDGVFDLALDLDDGSWQLTGQPAGQLVGSQD